MAAPIAPAWAVAAAILLVENEAIHYRKLARTVKETGLSKLGKRGGQTIEQTLRADMGKDYPEIFQGHGGRSGYYQIGDDDAALGRQEVREAVIGLAYQKLDEYRGLLYHAVFSRVDLSTPGAGQTKKRVEELEAQLARVARLYSARAGS